MKEIKFVLSLMTPRVWIAALVLLALALVAGLGAGGYIGHRVASASAATRIAQVTGTLAAERLDRAQERITHAADLATERKKVGAIEQQRLADIGAAAATHKEKMDEANAKIKSLTADVLTGAVRLSVAVQKARTAAGSCGASSDPAPASGDQETRAELVPQVAYDLIGIAADGDAAVLDLNACIDSYNALRKQPQQ